MCRVFKKRIAATTRRFNEHDSPIWYDDQVSFMPDMESPRQHSNPNNLSNYHYPYNPNSCKKEMDSHYRIPTPDHFLQLPNLESPKMLHQPHTSCNPVLPSYGGLINLNPGISHQEHMIHQTLDQNLHSMFRNGNEQSGDQVTDWRVLDKFVASQLSHEEISKDTDAFHASEESNMNKQEMLLENASTSSSSCQIQLWK